MTPTPYFRFTKFRHNTFPLFLLLFDIAHISGFLRPRMEISSFASINSVVHHKTVVTDAPALHLEFSLGTN
jgi:hypothetical protein